MTAGTGQTGMKTAIFSDIDGTLITSEHRISPRTRDAIRAVEEAGIPFFIVTARGMSGTYPLLEQNDIVCPVIVCNGGVILDAERRIIHHRGFSKAAAEEVVAFLEAEQLPLVWNAYSFEEWVVPTKRDPRVQNEERIVMAAAREGSVASLAHEEVQKILCICDAGTTDRTQQLLEERFPELDIARSSDILIEVLPRGMTKAAAVRLACAQWGIDPEDALAFGDSYNDVPMLEAVGAGYLMGNAPADLLARMPLHTADNDHDGIWVALRERGIISC